MTEEFVIETIWSKKSNESLFLDMYFIGDKSALKYKNGFFELVENVTITENYKKLTNIRTPFTIKEIREEKELGDEKFILTNKNNILRIDIRDINNGVINENITYHKFESNPESYFQTINNWFKKAKKIELTNN